MPAVRFCSACGTSLPAPPPVTCAACGVPHFRNPKPCANAIVVDGGKVLLVRRAHAPWYDAWCSPGGFCERGEHPMATVEREVLEETGQPVEVTEYLGVWVDEYADAPGDPESEVINVAYYLAAPAGRGGGSVDPAEVSEVRWFGWDELPENLAPPGTLEAVLAVARASLDGRRTTALPDRPR
jgi:ADP-ribose pyrophosphatase YjhB (NUDIX family)